mgnify:CR=1 FL=1
MRRDSVGSESPGSPPRSRRRSQKKRGELRFAVRWERRVPPLAQLRRVHVDRVPEAIPPVVDVEHVEVREPAEADLELEEALAAVRAMGERGELLLFVGTKASAKDAVRDAAVVLEMPYVTERWLGGTITNFKVISERVQYWQNLKPGKEKNHVFFYMYQQKAN